MQPVIDKPDLVPVNAIEPDPRNPRKTMSNLAALAQSIREFGVIERPVVTPTGNGRYQLLLGERRWRAAKLAGQTEIPVLVRELSGDAVELYVQSLVSNLQREDLDAIETGDALEELHRLGGGVTNRKIALLLGKSEQWVGQMRRIARLPNAIREIIKGFEKGIPTDVLVELARVEDADLQESLARSAMQGCNVRHFRERVRTDAGRPVRTSRRRDHTIRLANGISVHIRTRIPIVGIPEIVAVLEEAILTLRTRHDLAPVG
jgi:ParB family chromosome partitioning protein